MCSDRELVQRALREAGIDTRAFWLPVHRQEPYKAEDSEFPNSIEISQRGLWLPSSFSLTRSEAERVSEVMRSALEAG
jgi:perosamine synthetase